MSLISTGVGLKYLCNIERDTSAGSDAWGSPNTPTWTALASLLCHAWTSAGRESVSVDRTVVIEDRRVSLPLGTDVTERDRITSITTLSGGTHFEGPMGISSVLTYGDHIELTLERLR